MADHDKDEWADALEHLVEGDDSVHESNADASPESSELGQSNNEDEDLALAPPPAPLVFRALRERPVRQPPLRSRLEFRRTIIPIMLTMGVALPACAVGWFYLDLDSPLRGISVGFPIGFGLVGLVLLTLGVLNMLHVKHQLRQIQEAKSRNS